MDDLMSGSGTRSHWHSHPGVTIRHRTTRMHFSARGKAVSFFSTSWWPHVDLRRCAGARRGSHHRDRVWDVPATGHNGQRV